MNLSILICSYGAKEWRELAWSRAYPSAVDQAAVQVWHDEEGTLAEVRNRAATATTTEWLCFLDADDELAPGYVTAMEAAAATLQSDDLLVPALQFVYPSGALSEAGIPNRGRWPELNECVIGTLVRRSIFLAVGGFDEYPIYEDYALWLACERAGAGRRYVPEAVYRAHQKPEGRNTGPSATVKLTTYNEIRRQDKAAREERDVREVH